MVSSIVNCSTSSNRSQASISEFCFMKYVAHSCIKFENSRFKSVSNNINTFNISGIRSNPVAVSICRVILANVSKSSSASSLPLADNNFINTVISSFKS
ncbi:hypothetical protein DERP_002190 [Dermatophagoides pteronyssinus]|uniref:Uncharacterized protein n=1 Tax=Dermatophagoides pteronyssinus TaxID=6956 RepID=A0ABQ8JHP8_DERPT|nr:hypothetical protein DERP_002190 [Dermatophagoides pteronyssinus]